MKDVNNVRTSFIFFRCTTAFLYFFRLDCFREDIDYSDIPNRFYVLSYVEVQMFKKLNVGRNEFIYLSFDILGII